MDTHKNSGFTIIEVILFLAISSLMGVGILATASANINNQRYQDSVRSFFAQLQSEYSRVINVENSRDGNDLSCESGSIVDATSGGEGQSRGTSNCSIVGRVIDISGDTTVLHSEPVYATVNVMDRPLPPESDELALEESNLVIAPASISAPELNRTDYQLEWQTRVVDTDGSPLAMRLLIVRSPLSGMVRTYAQTGDLPALSSANIQNMIGQTKEVTACVDPAGLFAGLRQPQGVIIAANASSTAGLSTTEGAICN